MAATLSLSGFWAAFLPPLCGACGALARFWLDALYQSLRRYSAAAANSKKPPFAAASDTTSQRNCVAFAWLHDRIRAIPLPRFGGVFLVNLLGCFLIAFAVSSWSATAQRYFLAICFCGGFTTFSTAIVDVLRLWQTERKIYALTLLLAQFFGAFAALALGFALG